MNNKKSPKQTNKKKRITNKQNLHSKNKKQKTKQKKQTKNNPFHKQVIEKNMLYSLYYVSAC